MTTWENTDSIERVDNLTVTSDTAYERVTNDLKIEDTRDDGSLKQNTAWLVDEIPNISFIDIADTFLESKKTLADKAGQVLIVGNSGKSIETKHIEYFKDIIYKYSSSDMSLSGEETIPFSSTDLSSDNTWKFESNWNGIKILEDWLYRISFCWWINVWDGTRFRIWVYSPTYSIWLPYLQEQLDWINNNTIMMWWKSLTRVFHSWETIRLRLWTDATSCTVYAWDTLLQLEYIRTEPIWLH